MAEKSTASAVLYFHPKVYTCLPGILLALHFFISDLTFLDIRLNGEFMTLEGLNFIFASFF